ncbi:MAG: tripartite tricarboxylate transporter substrate binding protein [Burkholderiaceae bacterium]|nr:tripartite tricarboxylate transporter substrate binding protein [Desulfobacterales bacterium]MDP3138283.1 tripartite tricarboxylate transporter substrate binding protein [Burkholderiaceae bacterium]
MKRYLLAGIAAVLLALAGQTCAADFPVKPIRVIIPFSPGGITDVMGRALAVEMSRTLGQQVIVENRAGALGAIGTAAVASAPADGYTLLFVPSTFTQMPQTNKNLTFDVERDFEPITIPLVTPIFIFANSRHPAQNLNELMAYLRANPQTPYATSGIGSPGHVAFALLSEQLKIDLVHVPYKGGADSSAATAAGDVPLAVVAPQPGLGMAEQGRLKVLGVVGNSRSKLLPNVPSVGETGLPIVENKVWLGFLAPRGTPKDVVARLHKDISMALQSESVMARAKASAVDIETPISSADFAAQIGREVKVWADLYRRLKLQ